MGTGTSDRRGGLAGKAVQEMSTLDAAIALGRQGYRVFPVIENGKIPAIGAWPQRATTDEAEIRRMWTTHDPVLGTTTTRNYNIGIATQGLLVLDVDNKGDKRGSDTLAELDLMNGVPDTFTVETPSGGFHLYYRPLDEVANSAGRIGHGLDVRGQGGYVVAPGSTIDGKAYRVAKAAPLADAPFWLENDAGKAPRRDPKHRQVIDILDMQPAVDRATRMLLDAPAAIEGEGGDHHTFKIACAVKDAGVSELTALELMAVHFNPRCVPPWSDEALAIKVANAYRYGKRAIGEGSAQADFGPVETHGGDETADKPSGKKPRRLKFVLPRDISVIQRTKHLIKNWIEEESFVVTYGDSNVGKSFQDQAMHAHIALGLPWAGRKVTQGATCYIAAEGGRSAQLRVAALKKHFKVEDMPLALVASPVNLLDPKADVQELIELMLEVERQIGKIRYFTIDTLARAMAGGNENSPDDMGAFIANKDAIRAAVKAAGNTIHHKGKDGAKGMRGHSSLFAAADTVIEVSRGLITAVKQRDMDTGDTIDFDLKQIELGRDEDNMPITTAVAVFGTGDAARDFGGNPARTALVLRALRDCVEANSGRPVSWDEWREMCVNYINRGVSEGFSEAENGAEWPVPGNSRNAALRDERDRLEKHRAASKNRRDQWVAR